MRWAHPSVRGTFVALLFLGYPWAVVTLQRIVPGPAMMLGVVPVTAAAVLFGTRGGLIAAAVAACVDNLIARSLHVIAPDLLPWASLLSLGAYLVLVFGIGGLRRVWLRGSRANAELAAANAALAESNAALASANAALANEARLRSEMAAELHANATLYSSLLDSMVEGVGLFDGEDRFVYANAAADGLFSGVHGHLVGQSLRELVAPESVHTLENAGRGTARSGTTYTLATRAEGSDRRHLLVTETLLEPSAAVPARVLRVMHDVTVRERMEQEQRELARQVQLAQAMQSLGVLAGGVAHDFNNLLTGVLGHAELAMMRLGRATPEDMRHSLGEIRDFAREAAALAKQMLTYAGKGTLATESISVASVAGEALRLLQSTVAPRASLEQKVSAALPSVRGDRTQLRQVVVNLVMNAVESLGGRRGTVCLTVDAQHFGLDQLQGFWRPERPRAGQYVVITISDDGQGMSGDTLSRIFEPYYSTKAAGRGMGLAATLGIVRAHDASIGVESTEGKGSTFRILLRPDPEPVSASDGGPISVAGPWEPVRGQGVILLIDDERAVRSAGALVLEELGYRVLTASSGPDGLKQLAAESAAVRLVLLDLSMPEMDGHDTLAAMRRAGHDVPVLLISGYHHGDVAPLLRERGVVGFLQKPLRLDKLARSVREAMSDGSTIARVGADGTASAHTELQMLAKP